MATAFSEYTRIIGRGPNLSRPLLREEACAAMMQILDGAVDPVALGGFLLVLRQRGETAEEMAGFVDAVKARLPTHVPAARPDVDWPSYADKHRQQPWFVLAALLLARSGIKVLMHGIAGEPNNCAPTRPALAMLGVRSASSLDDAAIHLQKDNIAYIGLERFSPETEALFHLKPVLGVRSVANTFARDLNPLNAGLSIIGIVHTPYRPLHIEALRLLGQKNALVFKGVGGEAQRNPFKAGTVASLSTGKVEEMEWPATTNGNAFLWREENLAPECIAALWHGEVEHLAAEAAIIATAALVLKALGKAKSQTAAQELAATLWRGRHTRAAASMTLA
jgi:anthranilate phosphoribosyltransferase